MRKILPISLLLVAACASPPPDQPPPAAGPVDAAHNSRNALDWPGTYTGTLPCADCEGIRTTIRLDMDGSYERERIYVGRSSEPVRDAGVFSWNESGSAVTLAAEGEESRQYQVGENRLFHLDNDGNRIGGDLAGRYILEKTPRDPRVEDRRWILTELRGQPLEAGEGNREAFIRLDSGAERISGNTGCNNFFGRYVLEAGNRLRVAGNLGATMMACPDMETERVFLDVLSTIDNYSVAGDELTLNRARMAPLMRFRAAAGD